MRLTRIVELYGKFPYPFTTYEVITMPGILDTWLVVPCIYYEQQCCKQPSR